MSDNRSKWSYFNENDEEIIDESVTIQNKVWAKTAASIKSRDPNARPAPVQPRTNGWLNEVPFGDEFNYILKQKAIMLAELEARGIMFWSALTDYTIPATVWGSDSTRYSAVLPSGPSYGGAKDPTEESAYWFPQDLITTSRKSIDGYLIKKDVSLDYNLQIFSGQARSANIDLITDLSLTSSLVKGTNAVWAEGTNMGGLFAAVYPAVADTWYHVFAIKNTNTGAVDVGFDTSPFAINRPFGLGWTAYRRIGSFKTSLSISTTIAPFTAYEFAGGAVEYRWATRVFEYGFNISPPAYRTLRVITVPPDISPVAKMSVTLESLFGFIVLITSPYETDSEPDPKTFSTGYVDAGSNYSVAYFDVLADTLGRVGWRQIGAALIAGSLNTLGWIDRRVDVEES